MSLYLDLTFKLNILKNGSFIYNNVCVDEACLGPSKLDVFISYSLRDKNISVKRAHIA